MPKWLLFSGICLQFGVGVLHLECARPNWVRCVSPAT